jgi:hypothetical protein
MALNVTLSSLRAQVRDRADMKHTTFCTDSEINGYINSAYAELYDLLVDATEDYYVKSGTISCDGINDSFSLPSDFYKLNGVDYRLGGAAQPMEKFVFEDRNKYINNGTIIRYRIVGSKIFFKPLPSAQTITLWYTPAITLLSADGDTVDGVNGWEDYIVCDAAMKCLIKEESDVMVFIAEKKDLEKRIEAMSRNRDQGRPDRVTDVTGSKIPYYYLGDDAWL